ncbi:hypothetical protein ADIWIN_1550 [Winogradskyella psychrotolerans RS-3]|uniref:Cell wall anchor protein n=1 Tax=Winogradskyella psychrotolerans RS-3 TaxID=641526 RepID=S7VTE6_9FLAO|nr:hypothetical protein [Winogradskyella psychrotolerans]EPR73520.1 hypothetical protein ADIWIN_1550 [Winogradskyella psychrotolerans RS-3]
MRHFKTLLFSLLLTVTGISTAQVGIGTDAPDASSLLDLKSNSQGLLAPRMTTLERDAIASPAESLLVFDTDLDAFYYYNTTTSTWVELANNNAVKRNNYKLIKSADDLAAELVAGGGSSYQLKENTYYEINGTITLASPIDLNNAYISGLDANEDVLSAAGVVFKGSTGGGVRNVTLKGTKAFEITGPGISTTATLLVQNVVIDGMTSSVGSVSGLGLYFGNINQFINNTNGITFSNIGNLLLNTQAWLSSNNGTFETFTGDFGLIEKVSGFSTVEGSDVAMDVSSGSLSVGTGIIEGTVFSGTTLNPSGYIDGYTTGSYDGYNFSTSWEVDAPGIPRESDDSVTANLYYDELDTFGAVSVTNSTPFKLPVNTSAIRLFRTAEGTGGDSENRIIYEGEKARAVNVFASISFTTTDGTQFAFSIYKNGVKVIGTEAIVNVLNINERQSVSVIGTVTVEKNDYIELYVRKTSASNEQILISSYNLILN